MKRDIFFYFFWGITSVLTVIFFSSVLTPLLIYDFTGLSQGGNILHTGFSVTLWEKGLTHNIL